MTHHQPVALPQGAVVQYQMVTVQPGQTAMANESQLRPGNWGGIKVTGIIQIILGGLTIILGIASMAIQTFLYPIASPIWCGLAFYLVAGLLGLMAGLKRNHCIAVGYMIMSIFACLASTVVVGFSSVAIPGDLYCRYRSYSTPFSCNPGGRVAVSSILVILGVTEFIVSIVGASFTCGVVCCTGPTQTVVHYQAHPQVVVAGQPQAYYTGQAPQQQFAYPQQQTPSAPQGQFQPPPQVYSPEAAAQAPPQDQNLYQPLTK